MVNFWASAEVHMPATAGLERVRRCVEPYLNKALKRSPMADLDLTIRYVPIVMPKEMHYRYKERSKAKISQKIYDCAPYLDYDLFVNGAIENQIQEYINGIALSLPYLYKFGLTSGQVEDLADILDGACKLLSAQEQL